VKLKSGHPASLSLKTFWLLCAGLVLLRFIFPRFETHDLTAFLSWEVFSHYLWLPAFFIHDDLGIRDFAWVEQLLRQYQPLIGYRQAILQTGDGGQVLSATMGVAVMFTPFFMTGHLASLLLGFPADGLSLPYQVAIAAGGLCYSVLGIWILRKVLLSYFTEKISALTMAGIVLATGYFDLAAFHGGTPESLLFTLWVLLLFLSARFLSRPSYGLAAATGLTAGLIFLVRPFDAILVVPWFVWLAFRLSGKHAHLIVFGLFLFIFTASFQFVYWKIYTGRFYFNTAAFPPGSFQTFIPILGLAAIPAGYFIRYLAGLKPILQGLFLLVFCFVSGWNMAHAVKVQVSLSHFNQGPAKFFYPYNHEEAIPPAQRYFARSYLAAETELPDHPEWFQTRRIFSLRPALFRMNEGCRFSPWIDAPLSDFSKKPWIGLRARVLICCVGQAEGNSGNLVVSHIRDHKALNWQGTPFNGKNLKTGKWNEFTLNYIIHDPQKNDILNAYVWYTGNQQVFIRSFSVTLYEIRDDEYPR